MVLQSLLRHFPARIMSGRVVVVRRGDARPIRKVQELLRLFDGAKTTTLRAAHDGHPSVRAGNRATRIGVECSTSAMPRLLPELFRGPAATTQFGGATKPFSALTQTSGNRGWLITLQPNGGRGAPQPGDSQMRTLSFILAFGIVLMGPSMAGSSDRGLPGIGTFAYIGAPVAADTAMIVAAR